MTLEGNTILSSSILINEHHCDLLVPFTSGVHIHLVFCACRRSQSVTDTQDYATLDVEVELEEDGWTFGESIIRSLEAEGITIFDVVNPQTNR